MKRKTYHKIYTAIASEVREYKRIARIAKNERTASALRDAESKQRRTFAKIAELYQIRVKDMYPKLQHNFTALAAVECANETITSGIARVNIDRALTRVLTGKAAEWKKSASNRRKKQDNSVNPIKVRIDEIVEKCGGRQAVAEKVGMSLTALSHWLDRPGKMGPLVVLYNTLKLELKQNDSVFNTEKPQEGIDE